MNLNHRTYRPWPNEPSGTDRYVNKVRFQIAHSRERSLEKAANVIAGLLEENAELKKRVDLEWDGVARERDALRKENNELRDTISALRVDRERLRRALAVYGVGTQR